MRRCSHSLKNATAENISNGDRLMGNKDFLNDVLDKAEITPVLVDIGSACAQQKMFAPIAESSTIVGFDADSRGQDQKFSQGFKSGHLVPKAVTADAGKESVEFVLTEYPECSSTLEPDLPALEELIFHDYFRPIKKVSAPAITLNEALRSLNLDQCDWLKLDSQGTDLSILKSLDEDSFDQLVAVDIEPGLVSAYIGEDLFDVTHKFLFESGFWLSDLNVQEFSRIRPQTAKELASTIEFDDVARLFKTSPTAAEARYLRKLTYFQDAETDERAHVLSVVFAVLDDQLGYALDVLRICDQKYAKAPWLIAASDGIYEILRRRKRRLKVRDVVRSSKLARKGAKKLTSLLNGLS
jgi:hypothetical protein